MSEKMEISPENQRKKDKVIRKLNDYHDMSSVMPYIDLPTTRLTEHWITLQPGECAPMELDWARCASRVGQRNAVKQCRKYLEDMQECVHHFKQQARYVAMYEERMRQQRPFMKAPEPDSSHVWTM